MTKWFQIKKFVIICFSRALSSAFTRLHVNEKPAKAGAQNGCWLFVKRFLKNGFSYSHLVILSNSLSIFIILSIFGKHDFSFRRNYGDVIFLFFQI